ncbi:MAG: proline racemase family protein [Candidatus Rokubacteria bacterium]|nr:proline racemase family protein [Candidatus Rokubacteria bacterium]
MRIIEADAPALVGDTMLDRSRDFARRHDDVRRLVLDEPRGHAAMCAAFLTAPADARADRGVVFVEPLGVVHMCGHGAIAIATLLVETGAVAMRAPQTLVTLDTAAGLVAARVHVAGDRVTGVTIRNVPSYSALLDAKVAVPGLGAVDYDLAYGGHFYAIVDAARIGLRLVPEASAELVAAGERIRRAIEATVPLVHPEGDQSRGLLYVQFTGPASAPDADARNAVVVAPGALDRSPCGTGTSARLANLWARRAIAVGAPFVHESIIGTRFVGRVAEVTRVGPYEAVVPEITGRAWLCAINHLVLQPDDPFPAGFRVW